VQVLGIGPDADNNEINRAYAKKKYEYRHDTANLQKVEQAHSSLMLSAFSRRVKVI
jgi:curved DNA-binding protein CbpA